MRNLAILATAVVLLTGCGEPEKSIHVTETRRLTFYDEDYPGNLKDKPPLGWRRLPGTQMRALNYVAGKDESVEIVLGETNGGVLPNANRWLGQYGLTPVQSLDFLGTTEFLDNTAYLVEASGTYSPGMGKPPVENSALIGLIRQSGQSVTTLKMTGPAAEVEALRDEFFEYSRSFTLVTKLFITDPEEKDAESETAKPTEPVPENE